MFALIANLIGPNRTWLIRWTIFASLLGYKGDTMHARATIDVRVPPVGVLWMKVENKRKSSRIFVPFCPWKLQDAIDQRLYYIISSIRSSDEDASHFCSLIEATKHNTSLFLLLTLTHAKQFSKIWVLVPLTYSLTQVRPPRSELVQALLFIIARCLPTR